MANAKKYDAKAQILGVQVQQMLAGGQEVIIGAVTDPSFGKLVAFGLGGVLVEIMKDITFRLAPASRTTRCRCSTASPPRKCSTACVAPIPVNRDALATLIENVSRLIADFPRSPKWI